MEPLAALGKVLVVSPHLDDAVFGCGELLAAHPGGIVVTVFAGAPMHYGELTEWDAAAGFSLGQDIMAARREEDRRALAMVGALPLWLDYCDSQYQRPPPTQMVAAALESTLARHEPDTVVVPLGLFHSDHKLVHEAALITLKRCQRRTWFAYEDTLYRRIPGLLQERLSALLTAGITATPVALALRGCKGCKRYAVRCYSSQLRALATPGRLGHLDAFSPEAYWRLAIRA
jgi:LmbE family N-acetylglucosaminyl deacetylase